jgi:hypothetical protein
MRRGRSRCLLLITSHLLNRHAIHWLSLLAISVRLMPFDFSRMLVSSHGPCSGPAPFVHRDGTTALVSSRQKDGRRRIGS